MNKEQMNIVFVGHVDHGKSTVIGRLLADTNSLPEGKLEQVRKNCEKNAKPFEYAFLLDALKDEQSQGITIDVARCFFKSERRDYIVIDAPGHIEFLKNMVTGAARAETAFIVIDAKEGVRENSKRHGYLLSMLGVKQFSVIVNKMDLINFDENIFQQVKTEYTDFLSELNLEPVSYIPVSAINGDNITGPSKNLLWYKGHSVLEQLDSFKGEEVDEKYSFRFPVQDIYKFTGSDDDRRIIAGTVQSGSVKIGEEVVFLPSGKKSSIKSIEAFNTDVQTEASTGQAIGFTLNEQIYLNPGELMVKVNDIKPEIGTAFKANIFWMGKAPLIKSKLYKLKIGAKREPVKLLNVNCVIDASELDSVNNKQQVDRHDIAECIFETSRPIAFDRSTDNKFTGRFVIVDDYEIAAAGIILANAPVDKSSLEDHINAREAYWEKGEITQGERLEAYKHKSKFIVLTFKDEHLQEKINETAKSLEKYLFKNNSIVYYLGINSIMHGIGSDINVSYKERLDYITRIGELAHILTDSGQIFITTIKNLDDYEIQKLRLLNKPNEILVINIGMRGIINSNANINISEECSVESIVEQIYNNLKRREIVIEYYI